MANRQLFLNNFKTLIDAGGGINASDTGVNITPGGGALLGAIAGGDYYLATLDADPSDPDSVKEVVKITGRTTDLLTLVRAREGTTGQIWPAGSVLEIRVTAGALTDFPQVATWSRKVRQTLTDKTSFSGTGAEQWGTEEATLDDALLPGLTNVTVFAQVTGSLQNHTETALLIMQVEISLDGGSTWDIGNVIYQARQSTASNQTTSRNPISAMHQITGTVTGDIQARVKATCATGASTAWDLILGVMYMDVSVEV